MLLSHLYGIPTSKKKKQQIKIWIEQFHWEELYFCFLFFIALKLNNTEDDAQIHKRIKTQSRRESRRRRWRWTTPTLFDDRLIEMQFRSNAPFFFLSVVCFIVYSHMFIFCQCYFFVFDLFNRLLFLFYFFLCV